jgi:uncharacterized protein YggU (UPF0235/DUF167 family)
MVIGGNIVTQTATENVGVISSLYVDEPLITDNLTGDITVAASVYIKAAPTEGETNTALYVAAGAVDFKGTLAVTGDTTLTGDLVVSGAGPHAIGGATIGRVRLLLDGAFTSDGSSDGSEVLRVQGAFTGASGDTDHLSGAWFVNSIVTQTATENIAVVSQVRIDEPGITDNLTGDITIAASLYITAAPTEGETNAALYVASGYSTFKAQVGLGTNPSASTYANCGQGTTGVSSLRMAHGSAPSSPVNGDIWTTTAGIFVRINGSTVGPLS